MPQMQSFEILESPDEGVRFCIASSDESITTGLIILKSDGELAKHRWSTAAQLLQVNGQCNLTVLDGNDEIVAQHELAPGNSLELPSNEWHIVTNTGDDESILLFKIIGDATNMVDNIRHTYAAIDLEVVS